MTVTSTSDETRRVRGKEATRGASIGFFVDCFDIYLPVVALGPANAYFFPASMSATAEAVLGATVFVATLLGRPLGALLFGQLADRRGRKFTTVFSVVGFGIGTLLMALLPGYATWGVGAAVALISLRFVSGVFMGGEYTAAIPLAMESSPKHKRGFYGGCITMAFPSAYIAISLVTLVLLRVFPSGDASSPYSVWGWRVAFVVGALMAFAFAWYYNSKVDESDSFLAVAGKKRENPLRVLFGQRHRRTFLQALFVMLGVWFATNVATAMLPALLQTYDDLTPSALTWVLIVAEGGLVVALPLLGVVSQRVGRKPFLVGAAVATAVVPSVAYYVLATLQPRSFAVIAALSLVVVVGALCCYGATASYLSERFPAEIRASGYGLGYSLALIIPAFYPYMQQGLASVMPFALTPLVFLVVGGVLMAGATLRGPETRHVDI